MRHFLICIVVYLRLSKGAELLPSFEVISDNLETFGADGINSVEDLDLFDVFFYSEDDDEDHVTALPVDDERIIALSDSDDCEHIPVVPALPAQPVISRPSETTIVSPTLPLTPKMERQKLIKTRLREIFKTKYPTTKYNLRNYDVLNWPKDISIFKDRFKRSEMDQIEERLPFIDFVPKVEVISTETELGLDKFECLTAAELIPKFTKADFMKIIKARFNLENGCPGITKIDWNLLDRSALPAKYENVPINSITYGSKLIYANKEIIDNIHFHGQLQIGSASSKKRNISEVSLDELASSVVSSSDRASKHCRLSLKNDLKKLFEEQFPGKKYNLGKYKILNWPQEVDLLSQYQSIRDVQMIRERFHLFRFVLRAGLKKGPSGSII